MSEGERGIKRGRQGERDWERLGKGRPNRRPRSHLGLSWSDGILPDGFWLTLAESTRVMQGSCLPLSCRTMCFMYFQVCTDIAYWPIKHSSSRKIFWPILSLLSLSARYAFRVSISTPSILHPSILNPIFYLTVTADLHPLYQSTLSD